MSLFEFYRMGIPLFVPSPALLTDWHIRYLLTVNSPSLLLCFFFTILIRYLFIINILASFSIFFVDHIFFHVLHFSNICFLYSFLHFQFTLCFFCCFLIFVSKNCKKNYVLHFLRLPTNFFAQVFLILLQP